LDRLKASMGTPLVKQEPREHVAVAIEQTPSGVRSLPSSSSSSSLLQSNLGNTATRVLMAPDSGSGSGNAYRTSFATSNPVKKNSSNPFFHTPGVHNNTNTTSSSSSSSNVTVKGATAATPSTLGAKAVPTNVLPMKVIVKQELPSGKKRSASTGTSYNNRTFRDPTKKKKAKSNLYGFFTSSKKVK
jgi:hypothetical protein